MATTLSRNYRYPGQSIEPDVAGDLQKLAEDVDTDVDRLYDNLPGKIAYGSDSISIGSGAATVTKVITLPAGFAAAPVINLQSTSNVAGRASLLGLYVTAKSATQFTVKLQTSDNANAGTSYAISFDWTAVGA